MIKKRQQKQAAAEAHQHTHVTKANSKLEK